MYRKFYALLILISISTVLFETSCKKDDEDSNALNPYNYSLPILTTNVVTNISQNGALGGGKITSDGGASVTSKGVCWSKSQYPGVNDDHSVDGAGTADFLSAIVGLDVGTTYYVRAYAVNAAGVGYGAQQSFTTTDSLELGINYEGGIIFYLDTSGRHGLVCAPTDQSISAKWGCDSMAISGANGVIIGSGLQNTIDIIAGCDTFGIAAEICSNLVLNGHSDWFLPSKDELSRMFSVLKANGIGSFSNFQYWSSSEMTAAFAWQVVFNNGIVQAVGKDNLVSVRAVRAF